MDSVTSNDGPDQTRPQVPLVAATAPRPGPTALAPGALVRHLLTRSPLIGTPAMVALAGGWFMIASCVGALTVLAAAAGRGLPVATVLAAAGLLGVMGLTLVTLQGRVPVVLPHLMVNLTTLALGAVVARTADPLWQVASFPFVIPIVVYVVLFYPLGYALAYAAVALATVTGVAVGSGLGAQALVVDVVAAALGVVTTWLVHTAARTETDALTGLPNLRGMNRFIDECVQRSRTHRASTLPALSLALIVVDHHEDVIAAAGHGVADRLLRECAVIWRDRLPADTVLARLDAAGFAVVLPDRDTQMSTEIVEDLRAALADRASCSIGVAAWRTGDSSTTVVHRAENALLQAQQAGGGRVVAHHDVTRAADELSAGLDDGQLVAYYQPIVSLPEGRLVGVEALARWRHPRRGVLAPSQFVDLAERSGLIGRLDAWMLQRACLDAAEWVREGVLDKVTVNVSTLELQEPDFADRVLGVLADTGLPPRHLVLEITEGALENDMPEALAALTRLREFGVRVAVDDFGTGYSSLSRLDQLPVDVLKIDRAFVQAIPEGEAAAPIVAAVIALAHALGLTVVAEGIERPYQEAALTRMGCPEGQGYLYSRPVPAERITAGRFEPVAAPTT